MTHVSEPLEQSPPPHSSGSYHQESCCNVIVANIQQEGASKMETRYWKTLLAVLESGSFSRTAGDLNVTQSAVSQRIRFMEEQYGMPLIDRTGAVIIATAAGSAVTRKARQILALEMELDEELKGLRSNTRLSIACTPTFGIVYLPKVLSRFFLVNSDEAKFKSSLNTPEKVLKGILGNEFDIAVIEHCFELDLADVVTISLPPDELTIVSAPSLGLSGRTLPLAELLEQRLIARRDGCSSRCLLDNNLLQFGKKLDDFRSMVIHDDLYLTIQSTLSGQGVAFVSRSLVRESIENGSLLEHTVEGFSFLRSRSIIFNRKRRENECVRKFVECVQSVF
jgi:DNA-binding transcriptional LysR family regulator